MFKCTVEYILNGQVISYTGILCNIYTYKQLRYLVAHGVIALPDKSTVITVVGPNIYYCKWHLVGLGNKVLLSVISSEQATYV